MKRVICNVADGQYAKGQQRLLKAFDPAIVAGMGSGDSVKIVTWCNSLPMYSPKHSEVPYAFKAWAVKAADDVHEADSILWCDACIVPGARPLADLWERIETEGYWISNNGFTNYEWTADSAYPDLFPEYCLAVSEAREREDALNETREVNRRIPHVVATTFGLSMRHPIGRNFLAEYLRLAQTNAFKGPWINLTNGVSNDPRCQPCGPADVRGHRHDQTAASVIAWRLGMKLTNAPDFFAYKGGETVRTILVADGAY